MLDFGEGLYFLDFLKILDFLDFLEILEGVGDMGGAATEGY